jgi:hypothetical protein
MNNVSNDATIHRLANEFPDVPARILAAVLASYVPLTKTISDAIAATRYRIADACAF